MEELYKKSIIALKQYDNKPNVREWNKLAKEYYFMNTKTMCYISGMSWDNLCNTVRNSNCKIL